MLLATSSKCEKIQYVKKEDIKFHLGYNLGNVKKKTKHNNSHAQGRLE